jgi:hypothetical protein
MDDSAQLVEAALRASPPRAFASAALAQFSCGALEPVVSVTSADGAAGLGDASQVRLLPSFRAKPYPALGFSTEAVHTPARMNVTWVTPLGEEVASTS